MRGILHFRGAVYALFLLCLMGHSFAQPLSGILPKNGANIHTFTVNYQWNSAPNALNYRVMVASNNTFTSNYSESPITNLTTWNTFVATQGTYYWRIKAYTANDSILSPTYSFSYFTPGSLNATSLWLKADAGVTPDATNKVQQWADLSANGYVLSQNLAAKRPTVVNNAINGFPSLGFSGAQVLSGGDILDLGFNSRAMFVVGKMAASNQTLLAKSKAANATFRYGLIKDGNATAFLFQSDNNTSNYSNFNTTTYALYQALVNRTTAKNHLVVNNASLGVSSFNSNLLFESNFRFLVGAYNNANDDGELLFLNGNICEIVFADTNDSLDIQKINNYLKYKYTPALNLGADLTINNGFCPQTLNAGAGFTNYLWSTGATTASIAVNQTGSYWVSANDAFGYTWSDTVYVKFPTINPPSSTSLCANSSLIWNTGLGAGYTHVWNTGASTNSITISQAGTYSLTVTGSGGCPSPLQQYVISLDPYPITAFLGADTSLCIGNSIYLQIGAAETVSYLWNNGQTGETFSITSPGTYAISLLSTNMNGCIAEDTINVTVNGTAPSNNVTLPQSQCTNALIQFSNQASVPLPALISSQVWTFSNGLQLNGNTIQALFSTSGLIQGTLHVTANNNCSSTDTFSFVVHTPPDLLIQHQDSCTNAWISFQATDVSGNPIHAYAWDYFGGLIDTTALPTHMFTQAGTNQIQLIAQNTYGCSDTASYSFTVYAAPTANFSVNNSCELSTFTPINTSVAGDSSGIQSVLWDFGNNTIDSSYTPSYAYSSEGSYLMSLICYAGNGCTDTSSHVVEVHPIPDLSWNLTPSCLANPTSFTSTSTISSGTIDSTSWLVNLQYPIEGIQGQYTFTTLGIQFLHLIAMSDLGCHVDTLIEVFVNPGLSSDFVYEPEICVAGDQLTLTSNATGSSSLQWVINGISLEDSTSLNYLIPDSLTGGELSVYSITNNLFGCSDTTLTVIPINEPLLELVLNQVYLGSQNSQSIIGCSMQNAGTVSIVGGILTLSVSGIPRLSGTLNDTILPGDSYYYIFENSPNLAGLSQNNMVDFLCVNADLTGFHFMEEQQLSNNYSCLLIEDGTFSLGELSPNPVTNQSEFPLILTETAPVTVEVFDVLGNLCKRSENTLEVGTHVLSVFMNDKAAGVYFLRVSVGAEYKISQFIKI